MKRIPLSAPSLRGNEKKYVLDAIEQEWVSTGGSYIDAFEKDLAKYVGVSQAVACQSGTAGLHLALLLSGVERNDEVIVPTLTFIASVNPISYLGAYPVFMDCDHTLTMDVEKLREFFEKECEYKAGKLLNKQTSRQIKAIIAVHIFGNNCIMEAIMQLANLYDLKVIEDATEALGSYYQGGSYEGKYLGTIGDFGVYSFNGNKIITTGGGGMLVSKKIDLLNEARYLSTQAKDDPVFYQHNAIGYNYRMTNIQAAMGVAQLEQLESFIKCKERNYKLYDKLLSECKELELVHFSKEIRPNYWFYSIILNNKQLGVRTLIEKMQEKNIQIRPIWGLIHEQKPYQKAMHYKIDKANYYRQHIINVPCSSNLSEEEVYYVVDMLKEIINIG